MGGVIIRGIQCPFALLRVERIDMGMRGEGGEGRGERREGRGERGEVRGERGEWKGESSIPSLPSCGITFTSSTSFTRGFPRDVGSFISL